MTQKFNYKKNCILMNPQNLYKKNIMLISKNVVIVSWYKNIVLKNKFLKTKLIKFLFSGVNNRCKESVDCVTINWLS